MVRPEALARESTSGRSVLVVDDDDGCRALIVALLQRIGCAVHEARGGDEALDVALGVRPALVVLDVAIPQVSGYEVCRELRDAFGDGVSIMFVSGVRPEPLDRVAGLLIGADDYVAKPFDPDELVNRVRALLRRHRPNGHAPLPVGSAGIDTLTSREREVLTLLTRGRSQREIAAELVISEKTVATHIQRILGKLGVHSRAQAVVLALREGLGADVEAHVLHTELV